jgi:leucyl-tRNA synthetase
VDESALVRDSIQIVVQVNGKVRAKLELPANIEKDDAISAAKADAGVAKFLEGNTVRKEIYIPGKLINIVAT